MKFLITLPVVVLVCILSVLMIMAEAGVRDSWAVWYGNVKPTGIEYNNGNPKLKFVYGNNQHGYTASSDAVVKFAEKGSLPWLWCGVSRTGNGTCWTKMEVEKK